MRPEPVVEADYAALTRTAGWLVLDRDVLSCSGPDATTYLQGQLSADLEVLSIGDSAFSLLLEPNGRLTSFLRVTRRGSEAWLLDGDVGVGEATRARLARFKLRTRADLELMTGWRMLALRGPGAASVEMRIPDGTIRTRAAWPGLEGTDLLGPDLPAAVDGARACGPEAYEARRIEAGLPRPGAELDGQIIPAEAGLVEMAVSFTKGCYTGQELVARIDSRGGNVPRRLRGLQAEGAFSVGDPVAVGDAEVARVTSAAWSPARGWVGLAYLPRRFAEPGPARIGAGPGQIRALPLS